MEKRKRAPGGGRRPGEFGKLGEVISLRLPEKLKAKLKRVANQTGRTLSAEAIWRLNASFPDERPDSISRTVNELGFKIDEFQSWVVKVKRELRLRSRGRK